MKKSMIHKMAVVALLTTPLFVSCSQDDDVSITNVAKKNELQLSVGLYQAEGSRTYHTKYNTPTTADLYEYTGAPNPDHFENGAHIGIFVRRVTTPVKDSVYYFNNETPPATNYVGPYDNIDYWAVGNYTGPGTQRWITANSILLSDTTAMPAEICGYFLENHRAGTLSSGTANGYVPTMSFDGHIWNPSTPANVPPVDAGYNASLERIDSFLIHCNDGEELLYCPFSDAKQAESGVSIINGRHPNVNMLFRHAQAVLKLSVELAPGWTGAAGMSEFSVSGDFGVDGVYNATDNTYKICWQGPTDPAPSATSLTDTCTYRNVFATPVWDLSTAKWENQYYILPNPAHSLTSSLNYADDGNTSSWLEFNVKIGADQYTAKLAAPDNPIYLKRGYIYTIPLMVTNHTLIIGEVEIEPWNFTSLPIVPLIPKQ